MIELRQPTLTDIDHKLLRYIGGGLTVKEIATAAGWKPSTTKVYLSRLYCKTGKTRLQLERTLFSHALRRDPKQVEILLRQVLGVREDETRLIALIRQRVEANVIPT